MPARSENKSKAKHEGNVKSKNEHILGNLKNAFLTMLEIPSTLFVRGRFKLKSQAYHENLKKTCFIVFLFFFF